MYYVLVKEFGEYDYFKYEPIEVYKTLEDAENSKQLHITEDSYIHKISTLHRKPYDKPNFVIFQVNEKKYLNFEDELSNLKNKYENELAEASAWREQYNKDLIDKAAIETEKRLNMQKRIIYNVIDLWDNCNDEGKKSINIKEIEQTLLSYLKQTNDKYVWDWVRKYHIPLYNKN